MTLRLHDTAAGAVRDFQPLIPGRASVYLCGATMRAEPNIGQLRSVVCFDILVRWLEAVGYQVTYCRNVTDLDDSIRRAAARNGAAWWAFAERNYRAFASVCDLLGCRPPDVQPRATGHVPQMIALLRQLFTSGHAYLAGGDVYFSVPTATGYGSLSGQQGNPESGAAAADAELVAGKRDPRDFLLWKAVPEGARWDDPCWQSPWGPGRPGWHLECAAMSSTYLGATFDIHGGGTDLIFPHHENERALAHAVSAGFARYWLHHGLVVAHNPKLSALTPSLITVTELLTRVRPQELRYYLAQVHYRSALEFSPDALDGAIAAYRRLERFVTRARHVVGDPADPGTADAGTSHTGTAHPATADPGTAGGPGRAATALPISFVAAMDDDLGVPGALAAVHATVRDGNYALSRGDRDSVKACLGQARAMLTVLGLDPLDPGWRTSDPGGRLLAAVDALVALALRQREAARARGDYASADSIRDTLEDTGVVVEDTPEGPRWELAR